MKEYTETCRKWGFLQGIGSEIWGMPESAVLVPGETQLKLLTAGTRVEAVYRAASLDPDNKQVKATMAARHPPVVVYDPKTPRDVQESGSAKRRERERDRETTRARERDRGRGRGRANRGHHKAVPCHTVLVPRCQHPICGDPISRFLKGVAPRRRQHNERALGQHDLRRELQHRGVVRVDVGQPQKNSTTSVLRSRTP